MFRNNHKQPATLLERVGLRKRRADLRPYAVVPALGLAVTSIAGLIWWRSRMDNQEQVIDVAEREAIPPPALPDTVDGATNMQLLKDGSGPLYYRRYRADIDNPAFTPEALMEQVKGEINNFVPQELANFQKTKGEEGVFAVGDEYYIRITGPWDAWVRTIDVQPTSFSFVTLKRHLEAGEIHFRAETNPDKPGALRFEIQSWSRSRDPIVGFFYTFLGLAKIAQTGMWTMFCKRVAETSGGELVDTVKVVTLRTPYRAAFRRVRQTTAPAKPWERYSPLIERYSKSNLNFDLARKEEFTEVNGWRTDDYAVELPGESPGEPYPGGAWEKACEVLRNYEFPDPGLITGIFVPDTPLSERVMVLRAQFLVFSFLFGVKIDNVVDEYRDDPEKGRAKVWGFSYRTLEGHFEMGEITFSIWKFLDTGKVEFRIHAYSKVGVISNIFYRIGFAVFGRRLQTRFARTAMSRMRDFVTQRTSGIVYDTPIEQLETVDVKTVATDDAAAEKLDKIQEDISHEPLPPN